VALSSSPSTAKKKKKLMAPNSLNLKTKKIMPIYEAGRNQEDEPRKVFTEVAL
jgi:hypothetical protein